MKRIMLILLFSIMLVGCGTLEESKKEIVTALENNSTIKVTYNSEIPFEIKEDEYYEGTKDTTYYLLSFGVNGDFYNSTDKEKQEYFREVVKTLRENGDGLNCGSSKSCEFSEISTFYYEKEKDISILYTIDYSSFKAGNETIETLDQDQNFSSIGGSSQSSNSNDSNFNDWSESDSSNLNLEISNSQVKISGTLVYVTGEIKNTSSDSIDDIMEMVFLDENGGVIDVKPIIVELNPGETMYFDELVGNNVTHPTTVKLQE